MHSDCNVFFFTRSSAVVLFLLVFDSEGAPRDPAARAPADCRTQTERQLNQTAALLCSARSIAGAECPGSFSESTIFLSQARHQTTQMYITLAS